MPKVVYISYDGVLEPLGESQVLGYVERLAGRYDITLITYEKPQDQQDAVRVGLLQQRLERSGIQWICLRYHKAPAVLSTMFDILQGIRRGRSAAKRQTTIVHARGYVPALIALILTRYARAAFVFDMRGFWADEKVDGGHWTRNSPIYRITKYFERRFFQSAHAIVSLTHEGVRAFPTLGYAIPRETPTVVIPTCTDLERFAPGPKDSGLVAELGLEGRVVIGVNGTISNWYLRGAMLQSLAHLTRSLERAKILFVTREDPDRLRADAAAAGIPRESMVITSAAYDRMPEHMRLMDLGLFFIKVCFSKKGSCATKLAEYLATGVPVVINDGVGDSGAIVRERRAGLVLEEPSVSALQKALPLIRELIADPDTAKRCRATAAAYFDVAEGSRKYAALYEQLLANA